MISIKLNGNTCDIAPHTTLAEFLDTLGYDVMMVAVAINAVIVPKQQYASQQLASGDEVDVVIPMQGG